MEAAFLFCSICIGNYWCIYMDQKNRSKKKIRKLRLKRHLVEKEN